MLLRPCREDEVRLRFGKEQPLCLRAFEYALPPNTAGTHGDLGLLKLIPRLLRILLVMQKAGQPDFLILFPQVQPWAIVPQSPRHHAGHEQAHSGTTKPAASQD